MINNIWQDQDWNQFHLQDTIEGLKRIEDNSVDIVLCDPPYNIGKDFGNCKDNLELNQYLEWCDAWLSEAVRIMKPTASIFIYGFSEILAHISVRLDLNKRWLIWHYTNKTVPSYNGWQRSHESIIYAWKDKPYFNRDAVRTPYTETFLKNSAGKKRTASSTARFGTKSDTVYQAHESGALPRDVFTEISTLAGGAGRERYFMHDGKVYPASKIKDFNVNNCLKHPTQKPSKLTEKLILSAKPNGTTKVVIPFGGSGTEGIVCKRLGVDFVGFDINEDYIKMSNLALDQWKTIY